VQKNDQHLAWMTAITSWEGPVTIDGTQSSTSYLEMTGYE
jgi:predicted secreted hydrolase